MTAEELIPTRWIIAVSPPTRITIAHHLEKIRHIHGNTIARYCLSELHRIGIHPPHMERFYKHYQLNPLTECKN